MNKPHKHAYFIKAWAEGKEIEWRDPRIVLTSSPPQHDRWKPFSGQWHDVLEYRIKPDEAKFPSSKMTNQQLKKAFHAASGETEKGWRGIADAAIRHGIENGYLVAVPTNYIEQLKFVGRAPHE